MQNGNTVTYKFDAKQYVKTYLLVYVLVTLGAFLLLLGALFSNGTFAPYKAIPVFLFSVFVATAYGYNRARNQKGSSIVLSSNRVEFHRCKVNGYSADHAIHHKDSDISYVSNIVSCKVGAFFTVLEGDVERHCVSRTDYASRARVRQEHKLRIPAYFERQEELNLSLQTIAEGGPMPRQG